MRCGADGKSYRGGILRCPRTLRPWGLKLHQVSWPGLLHTTTSPSLGHCHESFSKYVLRSDMKRDAEKVIKWSID